MNTKLLVKPIKFSAVRPKSGLGLCVQARTDIGVSVAGDLNGRSTMGIFAKDVLNPPDRNLGGVRSSSKVKDLQHRYKI